MSLLIPTNLTANKGKRKPDKKNTTFNYNSPASVQKGNELETDLLDPGDQPNAEDKAGKSDEQPRKRAPVPVALVDPDPMQMMEPDEYGAELGKEARVWKVYVQETDKWDRELVDGWNKSLDVILVFAALFSAVSTSFLIESSGMLKQDPNDVSATALVAISQALLAIANNSSGDIISSTLSSNASSSFVPPPHAVVVNTLWFLSLSLSIATSLLAMLAKDWCHSFVANRTGHPWDQALRRQRKWVMIEQWKMQELITVLPSLIHISLLMFAIGLCIYVWDLSMTAAIPVVCVSGAAFAFYLWSSIIASFVKLFPYTTIISTALKSDYAHRQYQLFVALGKRWAVLLIGLARLVVQCLIMVLAMTPVVLIGLVCLPLLIAELLCSMLSYRSLDHFNIVNTTWYKCVDWTDDLISFDLRAGLLLNLIARLSDSSIEYIESTRMHIAKDNQDRIISLALQWLIQNCETPSSVAIALQALAGASSRIPSEPLKACQATLKIFQRLVSSSPDSLATADTQLYTRALEFLESNTKSSNGAYGSHNMEQNQDTGNSTEVQASQRTEGMEVMIWDLSAEHERKVVELISTTQILPTKENIEALSIGSSATSLGLRLLKGDIEPACVVFETIMKRLSDIISGSLKLDPAALQSLANAALVLTLCSQDSPLFSEMVQVYIEQRILSLRLSHYDTLPQSESRYVPTAETVIVACLLSRSSSQPHSTLGSRHLPVSAYAQRAVDMFTGSHIKNTLSQPMFYCVGLILVLFNPGQYGITWKLGDQIAEKQMEISNNYLYTGMFLSRDTQQNLHNHPESMGSNPEIIEFLSAVDQVSELSKPEIRQSAMTISLPAPIYCVLVWLGCTVRSDAQQAQCQRLLSNSVFPRLDDYFVTALQKHIASKVRFSHYALLRILWNNYQASDPGPPGTIQSQRLSIFQKARHVNANALFQARSRCFLATQFWLLLTLVGESSTDLQKKLNGIIENRTDLEIKNRGVDSVRAELEEEIIQGYERGHRFGLYSARVIECILEGRNVTSGDLFERITRDLEDVPRSLRGRSSFLDPPADTQSEPSPSLVPSSIIPGAPALDQPNQQLLTVESDSSLASSTSFMRALNTELPPSTVSIPISEDGEPGDTVAQSPASHVIIPILPGAKGSENA